MQKKNALPSLLYKSTIFVSREMLIDQHKCALLGTSRHSTLAQGTFFFSFFLSFLLFINANYFFSRSKKLPHATDRKNKKKNSKKRLRHFYSMTFITATTFIFYLFKSFIIDFLGHAGQNQKEAEKDILGETMGIEFHFDARVAFSYSPYFFLARLLA